MNRQTSDTSSHVAFWLVAALLIMNVALADAAVIAAVSSVITVMQLVVIAYTAALIDCGVLITAWQTHQVG